MIDLYHSRLVKAGAKGMVPHNDTHEKSTTTVDTVPSMTNNTVLVSTAAASDSVVRSEGEIGTAPAPTSLLRKPKRYGQLLFCGKR